MPSPPEMSSKKQDYNTPPYIYRWLDEEFHFTVDAAASEAHHLHETYYSLENDALTQSWVKDDWTPHTAFVNPPYGAGVPAKFFRHALADRRNHGVTSIFLVPPRTGTRYWHEFAQHADEIRLLCGRISFLLDDGTPDTRNTTPSVLVIFRPGLATQPRLTWVDLPRNVT